MLVYFLDTIMLRKVMDSAQVGNAAVGTARRCAGEPIFRVTCLAHAPARAAGRGSVHDVLTFLRINLQDVYAQTHGDIHTVK